VGKAARRKRERPPTAKAAEPIAPPSRVPRWIGPAAAGVAIFCYLVLKAFALHPQRVDEGIYFYDAVRLAEGARLYREIFFAHPPLQLLLPTLLVRVFGYHFMLLKALPQLAGAAQGLFVFLIARRVFKSNLAGVVAAVALLFADDFLKASSYATGIDEADALLFGGLLAALHRKPRVAGALAGAAAMNLLQVAPTAIVLVGAMWWNDRRDGKRAAIAFGAVVAVAHVVGIAYGGGDFFDQVYSYHLHKTVAEDAGSRQLGILYADDLFLFVGGTVALALGWTRIEPRVEVRRFLRASSIAVAVEIFAMATRPRVFPFYFQPVFAPFALAIGWAAARGLSSLRAAKSWRERAAPSAMLLAVLILPTLLTTPITEVVSSTRAEQRRNYAQRYEWKEAPLVGPLNGVVRALLWSGGERVAGSFHIAATEYLWNQSRSFDSYDAIVDAVVRSERQSTLFGDSGTVPLVALGAHRRIAGDFADTNAQRFASGATPAAQAIAQLEAAPPTLLLASGDAGVFSIEAFQRWRDERYVVEARFADHHGVRYTLYRRR